MTPPQTAGPRHSIMHGHHNMVSRPALGVHQHNTHPLNSIHSMHTGIAVATQGVSGRAQAVAVGRSSTPLTMVPGSVLSQAASR